MNACVLIAAPADRVGALVEALRGFATMVTSDEARAELLAAIGSFQAIVVADGFAPALTEGGAGESPLIRLSPVADLDALPRAVAAALERRREEDHRRAPELERLGVLPYGEYVELVRFRATRQYLLGLMRRHRGSVTDASVAAGIARESLHRQLRRHDVDADAFREPDAR